MFIFRLSAVFKHYVISVLFIPDYLTYTVFNMAAIMSYIFYVVKILHIYTEIGCICLDLLIECLHSDSTLALIFYFYFYFAYPLYYLLSSLSPIFISILIELLITNGKSPYLCERANWLCLSCQLVDHQNVH